LTLKRTDFEIFDFENCRDFEIRVKGHARSLKVAPLDRLSTVSYWCFVVSLSIGRIVLEILDFLKLGLGVTQGHRK